MGTANDSNPKDSKQNSNSNKTNGPTMPRAHSNLDILSQTAAVIEEVSLCGSSSSDSSTTTSDTSLPQAARVTPAEHHDAYHHIQKKNGYFPVDDRYPKSFLALPEISSHRNETMEYHPSHQHQPAIFLEKKRGFLPPALSFETCGGILVGGQPFSMETTSYYQSPGLYFSYSNGSGVAASCTGSTVGSKLVAIQRVMSPPQDQIVSEHQFHATAATVSTGSSNSNGDGGGSSPPSGGDGDTVVNSFLANPSNSFSSAGGASLSSSTNIASGIPTSTQYQFTGVTHAPFPMHSTAFVHPAGNAQQLTDNTQVAKGSIEFSDDMLRENFVLRQQVAASNSTIANLQNQVDLLQNEIRQLRQVPSGKISQIPIEEMLAIMREYGSEVSDTAMPPRKSYVQKASVVRQFRRWNPNFVEWFVHDNGKWIPKLGKVDELKRRQDARLSYSEQRCKKQKTSASSSETIKPQGAATTIVTAEAAAVQEENVLSMSTSSVPKQELPDSKVGNADLSTGDKSINHLTEI